MQKWQKSLIIILLILAVLGAFIGFAITKSGVSEIQLLNNLDVFGLIELILVFISLACGILDIYETYESKNDFGTPKFKVIINTQKRLKILITLLAFIIIFEFVLFFNSFDIHILPLCFITLTLTFMLAFRNIGNNGINENGILYCGIYHNWEDIQSHKIESDSTLEMNILINFFGFQYDNVIKFNFDSKDKNDIDSFLKEKLSLNIYTDK